VSDVNSTLPDDDALSAFANSALGGGRRRRRQQSVDNTETPAADTTPTEPPALAPAGDEPSPEPPADVDTSPPASQPASAQAEPDSARTAAEPAETPAAVAVEPVGEGKAAVPAQTPAPEAAPAAAVVESTQAAEPATSRAPKAEVGVRATTVPMSITSVPPGLRDGALIEVRVPDLGPHGSIATQCTIMVSNSVRDRFGHYQLQKKMAGEKEPSNALVIRRAFLNARRNDLFVAILREWYHQANAVDEEDYDEDGLLGEVVGRRPVRGRLRDSGQQSFRPSNQELATYDAFQVAYGFPDRSAFLEGVLDKFLPQLPAGRRR
jgi:hypothetical protein